MGGEKTAPKIFARAFFGPVASCALLAEMRGPSEVLGAAPPVPWRGHPSWMQGDPFNTGGTPLTQGGPPALLTCPLFFFFLPQVVYYTEMHKIFGDLSAQIDQPGLSDEQRERENEAKLSELRALSIVADD